MRALWRPLLVLLGSIISAHAQAHDARPLSINVEEQGKQFYHVRLRVPPTIEPDDRPSVRWPASCHMLNDRIGTGDLSDVETLALACRTPLEGQTITVHWPVYNPSISTLFRLQTADGRVLTQLQPPDQLSWAVPARPSFLDVAKGYLRLGVAHIWTGIDHLLFVTGLLILAGSVRRVLLAITGFTIAHSITLSLSALKLVMLPVPPVEASIALSILFLAREIARPNQESLARRYPIAVSSSFGLLHGFGFAAALREVGLPTGELATGLFCFNLGVEIGQVIYIVGVIALFLLARTLIRRSGLSLARIQGRGSELTGYALGLPAAYWFIERLEAFA